MDYKERARERFEEFKKEYDYDKLDEFYWEQKFLLEEEFKTISKEETRRRNDILMLLKGVVNQITQDSFSVKVTPVEKTMKQKVNEYLTFQQHMILDRMGSQRPINMQRGFGKTTCIVADILLNHNNSKVGIISTSRCQLETMFSIIQQLSKCSKEVENLYFTRDNIKIAYRSGLSTDIRRYSKNDNYDVVYSEAPYAETDISNTNKLVSIVEIY